tara:strand:+ start:6465 stop:6809 length:345 start_codon:yes stop_codon:yes gene_type:complete
MIIEPVKWEFFHDQLLAVSAGDDLEEIREEVKAGLAVLWRCESSEKGGFVVTRIDGDEFVVVLGEGSGAHEFLPHFVQFARSRKLKIRTHVTRKGMIRVWKRYGVFLSEYVLRG